MRKIVGLLILGVVLITAAGAQNFGGRSSSSVYVLPPFKLFFGEDDGTSPSLTKNGTLSLRVSGYLDFTLAPSTVAALPAASTNKGRMLGVTDGASSTDCSTGLSTSFVICVSDGSSWTAIGSGGGGSGTVTVKSSGSLVNTAFVTGGGTTQTQTPSATSTLDSSGNAVFAGGVTATGFVGTTAGGVGSYWNCTEGTAPSTDAAGNTFGGTGFEGMYCDSTAHAFKAKLNGGSVVNVPTIAGTLAVASGKTATFSNTMTQTATDGSTVAFGAGGTVLYSGARRWSCQPGIGDGTNAVTAATYLESICYNDTGSTVTLTGIKCFTDNSGSSTLAVTNGAGTALLTGAVTCTSSFAAGTQSGTTTIASGDFLKFTWVLDGTSKQLTSVVTGTY